MDALEDLEPHEQLAFGGLLRLLLRLDGVVTDAERDALDELGAELEPGALEAWLGRAARELRNDSAVEDAARTVVRRDARELIYAALLLVASSDTVSPGETALLDWLDKEWKLAKAGDPYRS